MNWHWLGLLAALGNIGLALWDKNIHAALGWLCCLLYVMGQIAPSWPRKGGQP